MRGRPALVPCVDHSITTTYSCMYGLRDTRSQDVRFAFGQVWSGLDPGSEPARNSFPCGQVRTRSVRTCLNLPRFSQACPNLPDRTRPAETPTRALALCEL